MSHSNIIKSIAIAVSTIEQDVISKLMSTETIVNNALFQTVSSKMEILLGDEYESYVEAFQSLTEAERTEFDTKNYWDYTAEEKRLADLEKAEAFVLLSQLALTLKQMSRGDVISVREVFGQGQLQPASIEQIILLQEQYYNQAIALIDRIMESSKSGFTGFVI